MRVKFTEAADTMKYGRVGAGAVVDVKDHDGAAFIARGIASKINKAKEVEKDG